MPLEASGSAVPRGGVWLVKPVVQHVISESGQRQAPD